MWGIFNWLKAPAATSPNNSELGVKKFRNMRIERVEYRGVGYTLWNTYNVVRMGPLDFFKYICQAEKPDTYHRAVRVQFLGLHNGLPTVKEYVLVTCNEIMKTVLKQENNQEGGVFISGDMYAQTKPVAGDNIITVSADEHQNLVSFARYFFTPQYVKAQHSVVEERAQTMINAWKGKELVDVTVEFPKFTSQVIATILLGYSKDPGEMPAAIETMTDLVYKLMHGVPLFPPLNWNSDFIKGKGILQNLVDEVYKFANSISGPATDSHSFIVHMIKAENADGTPRFKKQEVEDMIKVIFIGGQETTAKLLTHAVFFLCKHPEWQERLFNDLSETSEVLVEKFLAEVLREIPPALAVARTTNQPLDLYHDRGELLPANTVFVLLNTVSQKNANAWENPNEFNPERFQQDQSLFQSEKQAIPFGSGKNKCIGKDYAKEMSVTFMKELVRSLKFEFAAPNNGKIKPGFVLNLEEHVIIKTASR